MPLIEIKDFNVLTNNKLFLDQPVTNKRESMKNLSRCQETITIQQETGSFVKRYVKTNEYEYSSAN